MVRSSDTKDWQNFVSFLDEIFMERWSDRLWIALELLLRLLIPLIWSQSLVLIMVGLWLERLNVRFWWQESSSLMIISSGLTSRSINGNSAWWSLFVNWEKSIIPILSLSWLLMEWLASNCLQSITRLGDDPSLKTVHWIRSPLFLQIIVKGLKPYLFSMIALCFFNPY